MHWIADLIHHILNLFIMKSRFINYKGSLYIILEKGKDIFKIFTEERNLGFMKLYFEVHQRIFLRNYIRNEIDITSWNLSEILFQPSRQ
jgi:hypothetical protein